MADGAGELRTAIEHLIEQRVGSIQASYGIEPGSRVLAPTNPHAGGPDTVAEATFSTGYSGGLTILPAIWDLSLWGDSDVFVD